MKQEWQPDLVEWYHELLIHRNLNTTYGNFELELTTNMGFPQEGVCSAKFWIIAFDEAAKILNSHGVTGELFADDGNGLIGGKDIDYMTQRLNRVCRDLSQWGQTCGLTFNASKTVVILFSKSNIEKKKYEDKKLVKMDGIKIPFSETVKYLGVTLDSKISWKQHIENKTTACKKLMVMLNSNLRGMQAPKPKLSKWAYTGVVRPKLLYACMTWGSAINTLQQAKKLKLHPKPILK